MITPGTSAGDSAKGSVEQLRALRREALRRNEETEAKAQEARIEAEAFTKAAERLSNRSHEADAQARQFDTQGDPKKAANARLAAAGTRGLADQNYMMADKKGVVAAGFEREAYQHRTHATKLEARVKKKVEE